MEWSGKDETTLTKGLSFTYDGANRLKNSTGLGGYLDTESGITYDKNGNITSLVRAGTAVDNLSYSYAGNRPGCVQLSAVNDASGDNTGVKSGSSSYAYDVNGNMLNDGNRGAVLTYNFLNLPKTVIIGSKSFAYDYDAGGNKHKYSGDTVNIKYAGRFEYSGTNVLKRVSMSEGQLVPSGDTLRFDYFLKDHLGNVRVVWDESGKVIQKNDYYPFGLEIDRNSPIQTPAARNAINRYNFLGKETQVATGYIDLSRRFYDPATGRFMQVDPVTADQENYSTYQYGWNNPILRSDPNGDCPICDDFKRLVSSAKNFVNSFDIKATASFTVGLQAEAKSPFGKVVANGYSENLGSASIEKNKDGVKTSSQFMHITGEVDYPKVGESTARSGNKGLSESKSELAVEVGLENKINIGLGVDHTVDNDKHGNRSNGKSTVNLGLTGDFVRGSSAKTGLSLEIPDGGTARQVKSSPSTSITFGQSFIYGWEVKIDVKKRE